MIPSRLFLFCAAFLRSITLQAQAPLFLPAANSPLKVGEGAGTVLLSDVTRDGKRDILTRHLLTRRVEVWRGEGTGGFVRAGTLNFDYEPADIDLADLNRDGNPDLVVTSNNRDLVDVLLGNGQAGFRPAGGSPFTVSRLIDTYNKRSLHLTDLNGDGHLDIATANGRMRSSVRTLLGNGRGGFRPGPIIQLDTRGDGFALVFGDLNGDGKVDVVSASRGVASDSTAGRLAVQWGNGRGGFPVTPGSAMRIPPQPATVALADMDRDGRMDIVVGHSDQMVSVFRNAGSGSFEPFSGSPYETAAPLFNVVAGDVNDDGQMDLVIPTVRHVTVLLGGLPGFTPAAGSPFPAGLGTYNLAVADLNGDGRMDIAATDFEGDGLFILLGQK